MRVKFVEHAANGVLGEFRLVDGVNVEAGDGHLRNLEFAHLLDVDVLKSALCAGCACQQEEEKEDKVLHYDCFALLLVESTVLKMQK